MQLTYFNFYKNFFKESLGGYKMKIWKKILKLATVGVAVFALAACGNKTEETKP